MTSVSQLVSMYGKPQPNVKPSFGGPKPTTGRKWPPVNTSNSPADPPKSSPSPPAKSSFLHSAGAPSDSSENVPEWKRKLQQQTENRSRSDSTDLRKSWEKPKENERKLSFEATKPATNPLKPSPSPPKKPPFLHVGGTANDSSENIPEWKRKLQQQSETRNRTNSSEMRKPWEKPKDEEQKNDIPKWKRANANQSNEATVPDWKKNFEKSNDTSSATDESNPTPKWKQAPSKTPSFNSHMNRNISVENNEKPIPSWKTGSLPRDNVPWKKGAAQNDRTTPSPSDDFKSKLSSLSAFHNQQSGSTNESRKPDNPPSRNGSVTSQNSWKTNKVESPLNEAPALLPRDSFSAPDPTSPKPNEIRPKERSSFLHRPPPTAAPAMSSPRSNMERRRLPLPPDVYNRPPPVKPQKPSDVKLPVTDQPRKGYLNGLSGSRDLPPDVAQSPPGGTLPSKRTPSFLNHRKTEASNRNLPLPDRPTMPMPGGSHPPNIPPTRPPILPPSDMNEFPEPPPPVALRDLPPPPPGSRSPMPTPGMPNLPPGPIIPADDVYDETEGDIPPPLPSNPNRPLPPVRDSSCEIPTWDDEDMYDETADEAPPQIPHGRSSVPDIIPEESEEMYEDVETYMKLKAMQLAKQNGDFNKSTKDKEKKKKEEEKKEKEIRKKFKLPKDGEIVAQSPGLVKSDSRGSGKDLSVRAHEKIDIIRMNDNPKCKWLVRNKDGVFGYVDSDNIDIDTEAVRHAMQAAGSKPPLPAGFPHPMLSPGGVEESGEAIYDETPEDLYEEL